MGYVVLRSWTSIAVSTNEQSYISSTLQLLEGCFGLTKYNNSGTFARIYL